MKKPLFHKIYNFYRRDCCWPYAISFLLVLMIYRFDFIEPKKSCHWESIFSFGILFSYYIYNLRLYFRGKIAASDPQFLIGLLSIKIFAWGLILVLLFILRNRAL